MFQLCQKKQGNRLLIIPEADSYADDLFTLIWETFFVRKNQMIPKPTQKYRQPVAHLTAHIVAMMSIIHIAVSSFR